MITTLRDELRKARTLAESGDLAGVVRSLDRAMADLDDARLVTIDEAASLLGVRVPLVLQGLLRVHGVRTERHGETLLVPLSEVAHIDTSEWVQRLRMLDRLHDLSSNLGGDEPLTQEDLPSQVFLTRVAAGTA